jgi:predicted aminopeptidase
MDDHNPKRRLAGRVLLGALTTLLISAFIPGCGVGYVVRSAYFQAELLRSRTPVEEVRATQDLSEKHLAALDRIADVKAYGAEIGLKATENYETIAVDWNRTIWNMSACPSLSFQPVTWRFPVVGKVPYLGFFRQQDADKWVERMKGEGHEVYLRTAGAYSTLGWFRDPILPGMLEWKDQRLADTVLHELAHATLWVPGSVKFNESFANFIGETASFRYLSKRFGEEHEIYTNATSFQRDLAVWREILRGLYQDLDAVYSDPDRSDEDKMTARASLYASLTQRVESADLTQRDRFIEAVRKGPWNNARLVQYRTYNHKREWFQAVLDKEGGDILRFIAAIEHITDGADNPFSALEAAAGGTPPPPKK